MRRAWVKGAAGPRQVPGDRFATPPAEPEGAGRGRARSHFLVGDPVKLANPSTCFLVGTLRWDDIHPEGLL